MLLATVLTVVLSTSFKSTTDIKIAKLEEESQKALSAAESAVEEALKSSGNVIIGTGNLNAISGFSGGATISQVTSNTFTTPLLQKDEQYTLYVGTYDPATKTVGNSVQEDITLCFGGGSDIPAIEITLIQQNGLKKYVVDPNGTSRVNNATTAGSTCTIDGNYPYWFTIPAADIGITTKLLIARSLYGGGKMLFNRASTALPPQGRIVSSEARSTGSDVTKSVELFQSYPQIPSEFFVTSF